MFLAEIPNYMANIEDALARSDTDDTLRAAHTLKGTLGNFGALPAVQAALKIETLAEEGNLNQASKEFTTLAAEMVKVYAALSAFLE